MPHRVPPASEYRVRCSGAYHRFVLGGDCRLQLLDHPTETLADLVAFATLGGRVRCLQAALRAGAYFTNTWAARTLGRSHVRAATFVVDGDDPPAARGRDDNRCVLVGRDWLVARGWSAELLDSLQSYKHGRWMAA